MQTNIDFSKIKAKCQKLWCRVDISFLRPKLEAGIRDRRGKHKNPLLALKEYHFRCQTHNFKWTSLKELSNSTVDMKPTRSPARGPFFTISASNLVKVLPFHSQLVDSTFQQHSNNLKLSAFSISYFSVSLNSK